MGNIPNGIFDLPIRQRAAAPIGEAGALVDGQAQPRLNEVGIADLLVRAEGHQGDLRIEDGVGSLAGEVVDDFHILPAGMEDLEHLLIVHQQVEQRLHVEARRQRINRGGLLVIGDLDEAQFRPIGVLAHELGVDADEIGVGKPRADVGEGLGGGDQLVYLHRAFLYSQWPEPVGP